jgi:sugar phosphate isomerase/epimerase
MKFGIVTDYYGIQLCLEDSLKRIAKAGIKDVEIPGGHLAENISKPPSLSSPKNSKRLAEVRTMMKDLDITAWQLHGPYGANDLVAKTEKIRQKNIDVYKTWIDYAMELKAKSLIIHIGGRNDYCDSKDIEFIREKNVDSLCEMSKHIGSGKLMLAIENLPSRSMETPQAFNVFGNRIEDLKEIVEKANTGKIGICIDTGHVNVDSWDIPMSIRKAGKDLVATHIQENNGIYDTHMFPFSLRQRFSGMNWLEIFKAFKKIKYSSR